MNNKQAKPFSHGFRRRLARAGNSITALQNDTTDSDVKRELGAIDSAIQKLEQRIADICGTPPPSP